MIYRIKNPFIFTVFGASGDLAKLKIFPSLYSLAEQNRLPEKYSIVGYARTANERKVFQKEFEESVKTKYGKEVNEKILKELVSQVHYFAGQYNKQEDFEAYRIFLSRLHPRQTTHITYFSVPPFVFQDIIGNIALTRKSEGEDIRLILEKPFGNDTQSARELFHFVARYFSEEQVFLLDHYLGKSAVQSVLNLRHSNRLLNLMMKGPEVSNIQITAAESVGVTARIGYFDKVGIIEDMIQSHLLQVLALVTMSIPVIADSNSIHREKENILSALRFTESANNISLGQYISYKKEDGVPASSTTETFAALRLCINRESWHNTPIYIRTGKKLHEKHTYIVIEIKKFAFQPKEDEPNRVIIELQPDEKLNIRLINKYGSAQTTKGLTPSESLACIGDECLPEHAVLLLDVMRNRTSNFLSFPEIIATWQITDKISSFIKRKNLKPEIYEDGSEGPNSQNKVTERDRFQWFDIH